MSLFRVVVRKAISGSSGLNYKWSNVYYDEAADVSTAADHGIGIWNRERNFHNTNVYCYEIYASDLVPGTVNFVQKKPIAAQQYGQYGSTGEWYASFACVRVDLLVPASRASRKFFHLPLVEADVNNGASLVSSAITAITTGMDLIVAITSLRDESGNNITGWVNHGITSRRLGRQAFHDIPQPQSS
jgi:hypothetical protein